MDELVCRCCRLDLDTQPAVTHTECHHSETANDTRPIIRPNPTRYPPITALMRYLKTVPRLAHNAGYAWVILCLGAVGSG